MELKEQVAYLRGLIEGQEFQEEKEQVLWTQLLNICDQIAMDLEDIRGEQEELNQYVEAIDEDLSYLEEQYYPVDEEVGEESPQTMEGSS
ncbi:MAG TPA: hypothetical protein GXX33_02055 [Firmicutes bacterium]|uniref:Uncharacterized protein n=1 Tax=Capillibacterium thermochitinicola TaxID=2699427 RepID=A0A8J6HX15_9FIRM|nr:CD1247 N-terminal domain-containing protein [Capillibacterium thermochitinicola]MBA2132912.1 hypothetical protein [Capillibacterium thermochitinicola]HHW11779.1 hypothetical protein [Bacillota bacterium]